MFSESLNLLLPNLICWCSIMSQIVFQKKLFAVFRVKVTVKDHIIKISLSNISSELLILLQLNLALMAHHHKLDCPVKRLDCSVVVKVKVTEKVKNSSECSSGWYLLSCWTVCNQTWYGDAKSWAKVSCRKTGLLSSSSGSQLGLIWSDMTVSTISAELLIFLQPNLSGWYIIISWSALCKN